MLDMMKAGTVAGLCVLLIMSSTGVAFSQDEESFVKEQVVSKKDAIGLSVIFPGLGQMTAGSKLKGATIFLAEAASLIIFVNANEDYNTKKTTYDRDISIFNGMAKEGRSSYLEAQKMFNDVKKQSDDLDSLHSARNAAIIVAAGVYVYNLVDIIFLNPAGESRQAGLDNRRIEVSSTMVDRTPGVLLSTRF